MNNTVEFEYGEDDRIKRRFIYAQGIDEPVVMVVEPDHQGYYGLEEYSNIAYSWLCDPNDTCFDPQADYCADSFIDIEDVLIFANDYYLQDRPPLEDSKYYGYVFDGMNNVVAMTYMNDPNQTGDPNEMPYFAETYTYDPFGEVTIYDVNGIEQTESQIGNPYLFTGRRYDSESGLYYYRYRMYSPELGRFLQTDPIGYYDSMNLYQYCVNNPVNMTDPYGLFNWKRFRRGATSTFVGLAGTIGGATITIGSGGIGGVLGGGFIMTSGLTTLSVGIIQMVASVKDCEHKVDDLPTSYSGMIALPFGPLAVDMAEGTEQVITGDNWLDLFNNFLIDWEKDVND